MSHSNEFWNFGNADRSEDTPKGYFKPLFPHNLGRPLHHPEQDYNAHLISQIIKGFRVIGSGTHGEMTSADLELGIKLHEVNPGDGTPGSADADYAHYIEAGAKDYEWIWVPAEMGGITSSPLSVSGTAVDKNDCQNQLPTINAVASGGTPQYEFSLQASSGLSFGNISNWSTSNVFTQFNGSNLTPNTTYYIYCKDTVGGNIISSGITPTEIVAHTTSIVVDSNVSQPSGDDGQITVSITGGTGPFDYDLYRGSNPNDLSSAVLIESSNGTQSTTLTFPINATGSGTVSLNAGPYFAIVTDSTSLCQISDGPVSITEPSALSFLSGPINADCENGEHLLLIHSISGGTAPYEYSITDPNTDGYTWVNDPSFSNIPAGNTIVYPAVKDSTGFIVDGPIHTFQNPAPYAFALSSNDSDCSDQGGSIVFGALQGGPSPTVIGYELPAQWQFSVDGGNNFSATWTETNQGDPYTYGGLSSGSYDCVVRRVHSGGTPACASPFQNIGVAQAPDITATITYTDDVVCGSNGSGSIDISGVLSAGQNVNLDYTLTWTGPNIANSGSEVLSIDNYNISGLDSGTYVVLLTNNDSSQCQYTQIIVIADNSSNIALSSTSVNTPTCNGSTDGSVSLSVAGGTASYTYYYKLSSSNAWISLISLPTNVFNHDNLAAGSYDYKVVDGNECEDIIQDIIVTEPDEVNASILKNDDAGCYGGSNGSLTASATGGSGSYTYLWDNGETTQTISNLVAGDYTVTITDSNGCVSAAATEDINDFSQITISLDSQTNVSCNGLSDGSGQITVTGNGPFTYQWFEDVTNNLVSTDKNPIGLPAGEYNVTVTSTDGCTASSDGGWSLLITEPVALGIQVLNTTDESVSGQSDGEASIIVSGGVEPYTVSVIDNNGATVATLNGSAGQTQFDFNGLASGNYTVDVTDDTTCPIGTSFTINAGTGTVVASNIQQSTITCNGGSGSVQLTASGGSGSYEFSDDNFTWVGPFTSSTSYTHTFAGSYQGGTTNTFYVRDSITLDSDSQSIQMAHPSVISFDHSTTDETIAGAEDGTMTITNIVGGNGTYFKLEFFGPGTGSLGVINNPSASGPHSISSLAAGAHTVKVTDGTDTSCSYTYTINIGQGGAGVSITSVTSDDILCNGNTTDMVINVSGGSGTYRFSNDDGVNWSSYLSQTSYTFIDMNAGTYAIKVEDEDDYPNNIVTDSHTISEPAAISLGYTATSESIVGEDDGSVVIVVTGGSPNFDVQIQHTASGDSQLINGSGGQTSFTFNNLKSGGWTVLGADNNNCPISGSFNIVPGNPQISIVSLTGDDIDCNGGNTDVTMTVQGGSGDYRYSTFPSLTNSYSGTYEPVTTSTTNTWNVVSGTRYFFVKDNVTGTIASQAITISESTAISASVTGQESYPGANDAITVLTVSGGTAPYTVTGNGETLTINNSGGSVQFTTITSAGTYSFLVDDFKGCKKTVTYTVGTSNTSIQINSATPTATCFETTNGSIAVSGSGGSGDYGWSKDGGINYSDNINSFDNLAPGSYDIYMRDNVSGQEIAYTNNPVVILESDEIQVLSNLVTNGTCNSAPTYYIKFVGSGLTNNIVGNQSVQIQWISGNGGANISGTVANMTLQYITNSNNEFEGTFTSSDFLGISNADEEGSFTALITSDGCTYRANTVSYSTASDIVLSASLVSEPACHTDGWVYAVTATGGPSNSYNLSSSPGGSVLSGWDGSQTNITLAHTAGGTKALLAQHSDYSENGCQSNTMVVDVRKVFVMNVGGSVTIPACYDPNNSSTLDFTITGGLANFNDNDYRYKISDNDGSTFGPEQTYTGAVSMGVGNGTYKVKAYRIVNGVSTEGVCDVISTFNGTVTNPNPINGAVQSTTQPTQCGETGSITMVITGGNGTYQFSSDAGINWETLTVNGDGTYTFDLLPGTYTVQGRDTAGCVAFSETRTLTAPASPIYDNTQYYGCWRFAENESVEMDVFMADLTKQGNGQYQFTCSAADTPVNYNGKFTFNGFTQGSLGNLSTHIAQPVTVKDMVTLCEITISANQHGFVQIPYVAATGSITNADNSPVAGDVNDFRVTNISGGFGHPYQIELYDSNDNQYGTTLQVNTGTTSGWIYDLPSGDYTYKIYDNTTNGQSCGREFDTPMTATTTQVNETTFYHIHAGSGNVAPYADLFSAFGGWYLSDTTQTNDINLVMADLIENGDGSTNSYNITTPVTGTFEFAGPITGDDCGTTWTFNASTGLNYYYLAVPNNSSFPENLKTANPGVLQKSCNGFTANAFQERPFTYNGEAYTLYKLQSTTGSAADQWGFK